MAAKKTKLNTIRELAEMATGDVAHQTLSPVQRRAVREAADKMREWFEETMIPITVDTLMAFMAGTETMRIKPQDENPISAMLAPVLGIGQDSGRSVIVALAVGQLAADLLAGEITESDATDEDRP